MSQGWWLERTGPGSFIGRTANGLSVKIGHGDDEFTPGDLLALAVAGCNATSSDARFAAVLGDDYSSTVGISADYDKDTDRFTHMDVEFVADTSALSDDERAQLERRARGAIERKCTISHTVTTGMSVDVSFSSDF